MPSIEIRYETDGVEPYFEHEGYYDSINEAIEALIRLKEEFNELN